MAKDKRRKRLINPQTGGPKDPKTGRFLPKRKTLGVGIPSPETSSGTVEEHLRKLFNPRAIARGITARANGGDLVALRQVLAAQGSSGGLSQYDVSRLPLPELEVLTALLKKAQGQPLDSYDLKLLEQIRTPSAYQPPIEDDEEEEESESEPDVMYEILPPESKPKEPAKEGGPVITRPNPPAVGGPVVTRRKGGSILGFSENKSGPLGSYQDWPDDFDVPPDFHGKEKTN